MSRISVIETSLIPKTMNTPKSVNNGVFTFTTTMPDALYMLSRGKQPDLTWHRMSNQFKSSATELARASYLPLDQAAVYGQKLGYTLDTQLSQDNTIVFIDNITGQPTIAHRGSVTAKDWLVDDVLIAAGANRETERLRRARQITAAAEMKYKQKSNAIGHSLGGRLAERSGSGGEVVTFNKAAGLGDINSRLPNGTRQTDVRTKLDAVSALSSLGRRTASQPPIVYARQRNQANWFLPGPIRFLTNVAKSHSLGNLR
ncbi:hypothetical protein T492DRAFT_847416 [Pavlovales sp. CCMP2436]|nr:hypothetical protein T492DRAFT_847416 [Pavlovales sp. CCMP2436]